MLPVRENQEPGALREGRSALAPAGWGSGNQATRKYKVEVARGFWV
jgi:hypothetical protein